MNEDCQLKVSLGQQDLSSLISYRSENSGSALSCTATHLLTRKSN